MIAARSYRMLKKSAAGVPRLAETALRGRSHHSEAQRTEGEGKVLIRSLLIEARVQAKLGMYLLASLLAAALLDGHFEHPALV